MQTGSCSVHGIRHLGKEPSILLSFLGNTHTTCLLGNFYQPKISGRSFCRILYLKTVLESECQGKNVIIFIFPALGIFVIVKLSFFKIAPVQRSTSFGQLGGGVGFGFFKEKEYNQD